MQEGAVTSAGTTYPLERPFFVLATQNPIEQTGTYPLPEAQLDRFLLYIRVGYPSAEDEREVLARTTGTESPPVRQVARAGDIIAAQRLVREVAIGDPLLDYVTRLVRASRPDGTEVTYVREWVRWGAGPRAGQAMILAAKARALLAGRFAVTPDDLRAVAAPVLRHRVLVNFRAEGEGLTADQVTRVLLEQVAPPRSPLA
jgi:MoxR-like ATPase